MKITPFLLATFCCLGSLSADIEVPPMQQQEPEDLIIYNRILAKVNGKTISVVDVMKKMDLYLQKNYAHLANSKMARYQFYSSQWRDYLTQMIDTELMIADAEKLEVKVTEAEVREEMLTRFGPNIMPILDTLGLTYEEAKTMIHDEMIVQRMMWFRVNSKALSSVNSKDVKEAYKDFCEKNPEMEEWQYQVLSIRSADKTASEALASRAMELLSSKLDLVALSEQLKTPDEATTVSLSPDMQADERSVSSSHKEVLKTLTENSFSQPIAQVSRVDNSVVYRIFYLKKHSKKQVPSFEKMADQIKDQLLQNAASKENSQYLVKLRERLGYDEKHMTENLPSDFQPFALK
ncbi:MAG: SurA N-terminal domain-containing protein [Verrucomicrobia bacterium]|nr:SurA N-terminal domain-containing protein [Verrucomicrobiota bacterium]